MAVVNFPLYELDKRWPEGWKFRDLFGVLVFIPPTFTPFFFLSFLSFNPSLSTTRQDVR